MKPFRQWYKEHTGYPWPGLGYEYSIRIERRVLEACADYMDALHAEFKAELAEHVSQSTSHQTENLNGFTLAKRLRGE